MRRTQKRAGVLLAGLAVGLLAIAAQQAMAPADSSAQAQHDWRSEWAVAEGIALDIDTEGYNLPTAIAFVPQPGPGPKDPLYFVTELGGRVKVITNDRSVHIFAEDFFRREPDEELPDLDGETGLTGLCLAPEQGYVFVTFAYRDAERVLRNNIIRFDSQPQTFSLQPSGQRAFTEVLAKYEAAPSHQIGSCQVAGDTLFAGVGDGFQFQQSQSLDSLLGKVLRMTLDGQPAPGNPFLEADPGAAAGFVWAYGFRNPFGLQVVDDRLFVVDNGSNLDRFVEVQRGENYLWAGHDWSIGARADTAISPDVGPAQLEFVPAGATGLATPYDESFYVAMSKPEEAGLMRLGYSLAVATRPEVPEYFIKHQGSNLQLVVGVALGPDGLYFVPLMPDPAGRSAVIRASFDPERQHAFLLAHTTDPRSLMQLKGCFGCHQLYGEGGTGGPSLDAGPLMRRLDERLNSESYLQQLAEIDTLDREPFTSFRAERDEIRQAQGLERLRLWTIYHILEPRFDNPSSQMPNLGLTRAEATLIADYLIQERGWRQEAQDWILQYLPAVPRPRDLVLAFGLGLAAGGAGVGLVFAGLMLGSRWRRRRGA